MKRERLLRSKSSYLLKEEEDSKPEERSANTDEESEIVHGECPFGYTEEIRLRLPLTERSLMSNY